MRHECEKWLGDRWCRKPAVDYVERDCGDTGGGLRHRRAVRAWSIPFRSTGEQCT
jgi:hypothetical protein